jgi:hypothetical protein
MEAPISIKPRNLELTWKITFIIIMKTENQSDVWISKFKPRTKLTIPENSNFVQIKEYISTKMKLFNK